MTIIPNQGHILKKYNLGQILKKYKKGIYLETGLASGESSKLALDLGFKKVISIEIDKNSIIYVKKKLNKFIKKKKLLLVKGDSSKKINEILKKYKNISVFFLDAHDGNHTNNAPLEKELNEIEKIYKNQLIIVDDFAKIKFSNMDQKNYWGKKNNYKKIIDKLTNNFKCEVTEIYYGSIFSPNSILVNKKIPKNLVMVLKDLEGNIHFFFKPFILKLKKLIKLLLKLLLSKSMFNSIRKSYISTIHNLTKG